MFITKEDLTRDKLQQIISVWNTAERPRLERLNNYYRGKHKILFTRYKDKDKRHSRITVPFPSQIVNQYLGYNLGQPVKYDVPDEIKGILNYSDVRDKDLLMLKDCLIFSRAYELLWTDQEGFTRFDRVSPLNSITIYDDELQHDEMKAFIRFYRVKSIQPGVDEYRVEVYDETTVTVYRANGTFNLMEMLEQYPHYFGQVPAIEFILNNEEQGIFEQVIPLIDSYEELLSDEVDDYSAFVDCYMKMKGVKIDAEDAMAIKENRILMMDADADVDYLTKTINDAQIKNMLDNIKSLIFTMSNCPDFQDEKFMSDSGQALKLKLTGFNDISGQILGRLERALRKRIELIMDIENIKGEEFSDFNIVFTQNVPENLTDIATVVNSLRGLVSNETLLSLIPFIKDPVEEAKKVAEESAASLALYGFGEEEEEQVEE